MSKLEKFIDACNNIFPGKTSFTRKELNTIKTNGSCTIPWSYLQENKNTKPITFSIINTENKQVEEEKNETIELINEVPHQMKTASISDDVKEYIPFRDKNYVGTGDNYKIVQTIIKGNMFYPTYIFGIPGLGKTTMIEQVCAELRKPFIRAQITRETIDEDLIGSMQLKDGNTIWADGPVLKAYRYGAVLLLDEVDLNPNLMILQGILEGKPFYIKQTGEVVNPKEGFTVFATGNSKGLGETDYIGTMSLNEAQRDRYALYLEQDIMSITTEKKIAEKYITNEHLSIDENVKNSIFNWIEIVRNSYKEGKVDQYVSTRRIKFLFKTIHLLKKPQKAIEYVLSSYNEESKLALIMLWKACFQVEENNQNQENNTDNLQQEDQSEVDPTFAIAYTGNKYNAVVSGAY